MIRRLSIKANSKQLLASNPSFVHGLYVNIQSYVQENSFGSFKVLKHNFKNWCVALVVLLLYRIQTVFMRIAMA